MRIDEWADEVCCISSIFGVVGYIIGYVIGIVTMVMRWY